MAPFLAVFLLLALGCGIVAWHTIGHPMTRVRPAQPRRGVEKAEPEPVPEALPDPFPQMEPTPVVRPNDPFAHAPSAFGETRH